MAIPLSDHSSGIFDHPLENLLYVLKGGSTSTDPAPGGREEKSQTVRVTDPEKRRLRQNSVRLFRINSFDESPENLVSAIRKWLP